jgi:CRISPR-associated protein Cas5d
MLARGNAWICPTLLEVCKQRGAIGGTVRFQRYTTNYRGPLRKASLLRSGSSMQLFATVLVNVCYRLHGEIRGDEHSAMHHLQDLFNRRLEQGRCYRTPALGWREFTCSYWGPFRENEYEVDQDLNLAVPAMLERVWATPHSGRYAPRFAQGATVQNGVLKFAE